MIITDKIFSPTNKESELLDIIGRIYEAEIKPYKNLKFEKNSSDEELESEIEEEEYTPRELSEEELHERNLRIKAYIEDEYKKKKSLDLFIDNALLSDTPQEFEEWGLFNLPDLMELHRILVKRIGRRYLERIGYDPKQFLKDLHEVLDAYTLTDLLREYKTVDKRIFMFVYPLERKTEEDKKLLLHYCVNYLVSLFQYAVIDTEDRAIELFEKKYGSVIIDYISEGNIDEYSIYDEKSNTFINLDTERVYEDAYELLFKEYPGVNISEFRELEDKLRMCINARFTILYHDYLEKQARDKASRDKRRKAKVNNTNPFPNQISIDDLPKPNEGQIQAANFLLDRMVGLNHRVKEKKERAGVTSYVYTNNGLEVFISSENGKTFLLRGISPQIFSACASYLIEQYRDKDLKDDQVVKTQISTEEFIGVVFGIDLNNLKEVANFIYGLKTDGLAWMHATINLRSEDDIFFDFRSLFTQFSVDRDYITIGWVPEVRRTLLDPNASQIFKEPRGLYGLPPKAFQVGRYLNQQGQMYKNHTNDRAPVRVLPNGNIELIRTTKSILKNATAFRYEENLKNGKGHFLRDTGLSLEATLDRLKATPINHHQDGPNIIVNWRYEEDSEDDYRSMTATEDFEGSPEKWLQANIIFEIPAPENFEERLLEHTQKKAEQKKKARENSIKKAKREAHIKDNSIKKNNS